MHFFLVTGASKGIGRELTRQLVQAGYQVWGVARNGLLLEKLNEELQSHPGFHFSVCDVADPLHWDRLKTEMAAAQFNVETLLLNAGVYSDDAIENRATNFYSIKNAWKTFGPEVCQRQGGFIVIGSVFAFLRPSFKYSYAISKYEAYQFIRNLSQQQANEKVLFRYHILGPVNSGEGYISGWKSFFIPSAEKTARNIIKGLWKKELVQIFPFSSKLLLMMRKLLPAGAMNRLLIRLKR